MSWLFLLVLNMSISASVLFLTVMLLRTVLKKMPKRYFCILWAVVGVRLILPFTLPQVFSFLQSTDETAHTTIVLETEEINEQSHILPERDDTYNIDESETNIAAAYSDEKISAYVAYQGDNKLYNVLDENSNSVSVEGTITSSDVQPTKTESFLTFSFGQNIWEFISFVWLSGIAVIAFYVIFSCLKLKHDLRNAMHEQDNIYVSSCINTPFIFGIFQPKIYLPQNLSTQEQEMILAHEKSHIHNFDHFSKPFAFLILMIHWFNPLVWAAYFMFCRDVEIACDERVLAEIGKDKKKTYASVLLQCSLPRNPSVIVTPAFGETAVKERVREILKYRKPSKAVKLFCAILILAMTTAACTVQSPVGIKESDVSSEKNNTTNSSSEEIRIMTEYEQELFDLQNKMYDPPLSVTYQSEELSNMESDAVIFDIIDKLAQICYPDTDSEKKVQLYEDVVWKNEEDSPYRKIIVNYLIPETDNEILRRSRIAEFVEEINDMLPELRVSHIDATEEQLICIAVEEKIKAYCNEINLGIGTCRGYLKGVILGDIDPESPRITLPQVLDIIQKSYIDDNEKINRGLYIYLKLLELQSSPDRDFTGSGVYGDTEFYLAGKNEKLRMVKGYGDYDSIIFSKTYDGVTYSEELLLDGRYICRDSVYDLFWVKGNTNEQPKEPVNKIEPSQEAVGLLKFTSHFVNIMAETICSRHPNLTQEQMDKIIILYDIAAPYRGNYAYQISLVTGETDSSAPKLTLEDVRRIIEESPDKQEDNIDGRYYSVKDKRYNIMKRIYQIQYYPDWTDGIYYTYWLDGNSRKTRTEEIVMDSSALKIIYNRYDKDGKKIYTETLFGTDYNNN